MKNWYIHIIIIVTWSGVLYHVEWMRSYHPRPKAFRVIQWHCLFHETWYCTPDQVTIIIICIYIHFSDVFWSLILKKFGKFAITLHFLTFRHHVFSLWFHAWNLLYDTSPLKQVTGVSSVLKDSERESENLSSLVRLSVSYSQKSDSSNVVSFISHP